MSPAVAATRKYYKGRKGPMLGEHTSLTFTQKILAPNVQLFFPPVGRRNTISEKLPVSGFGRNQMAKSRLSYLSASVSGGNGVSLQAAQHQWKWLWLTTGKQHAEWKRTTASWAVRRRRDRPHPSAAACAGKHLLNIGYADVYASASVVMLTLIDVLFNIMLWRDG